MKAAHAAPSAARGFAAVLLPVVLLFVPGASHADISRPPDARQLGYEAGKRRDAAALERIILAHDTQGLAGYLPGFTQVGDDYALHHKEPAPLPPAIEQLIIKYYNEPVIGGQLSELVLSAGDLYRSRALFDLMYAELRTGKFRGNPWPMECLLHTDLEGIEPALVELLRLPRWSGPELSDPLVAFLAKRKYIAAIPVFKEMLERSPADSRAAHKIEDGLNQMRSREAVEALLWRLGWLKSQPSSSAVTRETSVVLGDIFYQPPELVPAYSVLRRALPAELSGDQQQYLIRLTRDRHDRDGARDLVASIHDWNSYAVVREALVAADDVGVWKETRAAIERIKPTLAPAQYDSAAAAFDRLIADPEKHFSEERQAQRTKEMNEKHQALLAFFPRHSMPDQALTEQQVATSDTYFDGMEKLLAACGDLPAAAGLRRELGGAYLEVGAAVRVQLKDPRRAVKYLERAEQLDALLASTYLADTRQFDLNDAKGAIAVYRNMFRDMDKKKSETSNRDDMAQDAASWSEQWLKAEIDFLSTGNRFSGTIDRNQVGGLVMFLLLGDSTGQQANFLGFGTPWERPVNAPRRLDPAHTRAWLELLPRSTFALWTAAPYLGALPDASAIVAFAEKHDPAGFASACYFAALSSAGDDASKLEGGGPLRSLIPGSGARLQAAAALFMERHRIRADLAPSPGMSSPEKTWALFMGALGKGEVNAALACLTPEMQRKFRPLFTGMKPDQLQAMAASFTKLVVGGKIGDDMQEAMVTRGGQAGLLYFVRLGGDWKIGEM